MLWLVFRKIDLFLISLNEVSKGNLLEENHYYPHGLPIQPLSGVSTDFSENRRKYQSNEYIKDLGLNWMDFQARQYDPQIGRFLSADPLADAGGEQVWSPYAAMGNVPENPVGPIGRYSGKVDQGIPWQIDQLISWRRGAKNAVVAFSKLNN